MCVCVCVFSNNVQRAHVVMSTKYVLVVGAVFADLSGFPQKSTKNVAGRIARLFIDYLFIYYFKPAARPCVFGRDDRKRILPNPV